MCELFGVTGRRKIRLNDYLKEFATHSVKNPNGWGMALFYENYVNIEKEPVPAIKSKYLKERLTSPIETDNMVAHIRYATKGSAEYKNCHPFVKRDNYNRAWTLVHNGTIFDSPELNPYIYVQKGETDSERILCHIIRQINTKQDELNRALDDEERFDVLNSVISTITKGNKVNLLIYDGKYLYVHSNHKGTILYSKGEDYVLFSTEPLGQVKWSPVKINRLEAYYQGELIKTGTFHNNEYIYKPDDMKLIHLDSSGL